MYGFALTGALGVGKSYLQQRLVSEHGYWTPTTWTTRPVTSSDLWMASLPKDEFVPLVRSGRLGLPMRFGDWWYAWPMSDVERLVESSGRRAALNVRPYTALSLASVLPGLRAVWLWLDSGNLEERRQGRGAARDEGDSGRARVGEDESEGEYSELFSTRVEAGSDALENLLALARE